MRILLITETNWIVDIVLEQNTSAAYLLSLSKGSDLDISIPEFSFHEADGTIRKKLNMQITQLDDVANTISQISRTQKYVDFCDKIKDGAKQVKSDLLNDLKVFGEKLNELRKLVDVIHYKDNIFIRARLRFISSKPPFKLSDCEIKGMKIHKFISLAAGFY